MSKYLAVWLIGTDQHKEAFEADVVEPIATGGVALFKLIEEKLRLVGPTVEKPKAELVAHIQGYISFRKVD